MQEILHIVQPFTRAHGQGLMPRQASQFKTADDAARRAEAMFNESLAGVVAYSMAVDEDAGEYGDPTLLASFGDVPDMA